MMRNEMRAHAPRRPGVCVRARESRLPHERAGAAGRRQSGPDDSDWCADLGVVGVGGNVGQEAGVDHLPRQAALD